MGFFDFLNPNKAMDRVSNDIGKGGDIPPPDPALIKAQISSMGLHAVSMFYNSEESQEGVRAFKEKRKPEFRKYVK